MADVYIYEVDTKKVTGQFFQELLVTNNESTCHENKKLQELDYISILADVFHNKVDFIRVRACYFMRSSTWGR
jgi:DNA phosphorothioation-dependent restriction protein DptG